MNHRTKTNIFVIGDHVDIKSNTSPGYNSSGGRACITQAKYVIDNRLTQDIEEDRIIHSR